MTKKDKALIVEGLNRICADVAALAAILESGTQGTVPHVPLSPENGTSGTVPHVPLPPENGTSRTVSPLSLSPDSNQEHGDGPACSTNVELQDRRPQRSVATGKDTRSVATGKDTRSVATGKDTRSVPPPPTYEQVRAVLAEKARTGYRAEVKSLLTKHGVKQLSEITDPAEYAVLMKESEAFAL